jgi:hypothetical protein
MDLGRTRLDCANHISLNSAVFRRRPSPAPFLVSRRAIQQSRPRGYQCDSSNKTDHDDCACRLGTEAACVNEDFASYT